MPRLDGAALALIVLASVVLPMSTTAAERSGNTGLGFGSTPSAQDLAPFFAISPNGATLPPGRGTVADGRAVFATACAQCHGAKLEGIAATGAPALVGGRGTLASAKPKKTVESYWPYATTLFDYIKRAMPFDKPGSLTDDQVYAVTAFILAEGDIVPKDAVMDRATLPVVHMPNRDGFRTYRGPDPRLYR